MSTRALLLTEAAPWAAAWERLDARCTRLPRDGRTLEAWREAVGARLRADAEPTLLVGQGDGVTVVAQVAQAPERALVVGALCVGPAPAVELPFPVIAAEPPPEPLETIWRAGFERLRALRAAGPFTLDPRLVAESRRVGRGPVSELLLVDEARYPWLVLVPRCAGAEERFHLSAEQRAGLELESAALVEALSRGLGAHKVNVATLGNVVRQLHVHHVGRTLGDPAWPGPVWGHSPRVPAAPHVSAERATQVLAHAAVARLFEPAS